MGHLTWTVDEETDGAIRMELKGSITEASDFAPLLERAKPRVRIDLQGIDRINSSGVREWIRFITCLTEDRDVRLERCSVPIVQQLNMIANMRGRAQVASIMLPYFCPLCAREQRVLVDLASGPVSIPESRPCPGYEGSSCDGTMEFDDLPEAYLAFLSL